MGTYNYHMDLPPKKILSLVACPDETFASLGYFIGASVGSSLSLIDIYSSVTVSGYIYYDDATTSWKIIGGNGISGVSFSSGALTITHGIIPGYGVSVARRDSGIEPRVGSVGDTTAQIKFYDNNVLQTTPNSNMRVFFSKPGYISKIDPLTVANNSANIWVLGVFEIN